VTAWFKYHYPLEYIYAMLRNENSAMTKMTYLLEARRLGIEILGPDVQKSVRDMMVDGEALRFGLSDVKQVGYTASDHIIALRPFTSWQDWTDRIVPKKCNARVIEHLHAVDAFRNIEGGPRNLEPEKNYMEYLSYPLDLEHVGDTGIKYHNIDQYDEEAKGEYLVVCGVTKSIKRTATYIRIELEDISGKMTCFGSMDNDLNEGEVVLALVGEKSMLGYARVDGLKERIASGRLDSFEKLLLGRAFEDVAELYGLGLGKLDRAKALVMPLSVRRVTTKTGKKMAFVTLTDGEQITKVTIFPKTWAAIENLVSEYRPICVKLSSLQDGGHTINEDGIVDAARLLQNRNGN
jgi:DNA polymerase III alpha subunit